MTTWRERTAIARECGSFTASDMREAKSWVTCAVGEQKDLHPEVVKYHHDISLKGFPLDSVLYELGDYYESDKNKIGFADAVCRNDFDMADDILDRIEDRVMQLKRDA